VSPVELHLAACRCLDDSIRAGRIPARPAPEAIAHIADAISARQTTKPPSINLDGIDTCGGNASATTSAA
jgi:hypothetical protein